jgi:sec-independent protein translocase protein TatA
MLAANPMLALIGPLGTTELIVIAILGLLIFGKRLPEVGKSLGKGIVEFKKGLSGIEEEVKGSGTSTSGKSLEDKNSSTTSTETKDRDHTA